MRPLGDIIEDCKQGNKPEYDELRYGLLALAAMQSIDHRQLREVLTNPPKNDLIKKMMSDSSSTMYSTALSKSPKEWLGWSNDPDNPEYQRFRQRAGKVLDKVLENHEASKGREE